MDEEGARFPEALVDSGDADPFSRGATPELLAGVQLTGTRSANRRPGYATVTISSASWASI